MDDWKLSVTPVVRLERPNKTFVLRFKQQVVIRRENARQITRRLSLSDVKFLQRHFLSLERKFHLWYFRIWERKYVGTIVPVISTVRDNWMCRFDFYLIF